LKPRPLASWLCGRFSFGEWLLVQAVRSDPGRLSVPLSCAWHTWPLDIALRLIALRAKFNGKGWFMAKAPLPKLTPLQLAERKLVKSKAEKRKLGAELVRELARLHTEAALQVLADVATKGSSEASRIVAAMALLDRGYGKSGPALADGGAGHAPTLYRRIELVDGSEENARQDKGIEAAGHQARDRPD
jgi:hypothetical protein